MNASPLAEALIKKGERALESAKTDLREGDMDSAVNRAYYAMFNIARAALLNAGMSESELPKTHSGLIAAFGEKAVKIRGLDPELGRALSKTESLRLRADYTGFQIDHPTAEGAVARAEMFVRTVEREFNLGGIVKEIGHGAASNQNMDAGKQADLTPDRTGESPAQSGQLSLDEKRREAAESWRRNYYDKRTGEHEAEPDSGRSAERTDEKDRRLERDTGLDFDPDR